MEIKRKKLGLSLRGGAFKGAAHLGFLKLLEEEEVEVDYIIGSSSGAVVGVVYALGMAPEEGLELFKLFNYKKLWSLNSILTGSIADHSLIERWIKRYMPFEDILFSQLKKKLYVQATDLEAMKEKVFSTGTVRDKLLASLAFPMLIPPVEINGRMYVDGDLSATYAVDYLRKKGAEIVIGINPGGNLSAKNSLSDKTLLGFSIAKKNFLDLHTSLYPPDLLIADIGGDVENMDRHRCDEAYANGYKSAKANISKIIKLIDS